MRTVLGILFCIKFICAGHFKLCSVITPKNFVSYMLLLYLVYLYSFVYGAKLGLLIPGSVRNSV